MPPNAHADQSTADYWVFEDWVERDPDDDAGLEQQQPEPPPPPPLRLVCLDYFCCFLIAVVACITGVQFLGFVLDDDRYSVVNVLPLLLTRMHMLPMKSSSSSSPAPTSWTTALALLPTCPAAPALSVPPVCYEWEKPAAAMVLPGSGSADSKWWHDEQDRDYNKAAKKCFDSAVRDATWSCDQQEDDYMAAIKCLDSQSDDTPPT